LRSRTLTVGFSSTNSSGTKAILMPHPAWTRAGDRIARFRGRKRTHDANALPPLADLFYDRYKEPLIDGRVLSYGSSLGPRAKAEPDRRISGRAYGDLLLFRFPSRNSHGQASLARLSDPTGGYRRVETGRFSCEYKLTCKSGREPQSSAVPTSNTVSTADRRSPGTAGPRHVWTAATVGRVRTRLAA
jgi:hypothetical protein